MSIPTKFTIEYACGHTCENVDLSSRLPGERKSFVRWLERKGKCPDCFHAEGRKKFVEKRRKEEAEDASHFDTVNDLPTLDGSPAQTAWGDVCRYQALTELYKGFVPERYEDEEAFNKAVLSKSKMIIRAGWWIDNWLDYKANLPNLLEAILSEVADPTSRNVSENVD